MDTAPNVGTAAPLFAARQPIAWIETVTNQLGPGHWRPYETRTWKTW